MTFRNEALLTSHIYRVRLNKMRCGAGTDGETRIRTGDTTIFSR